MTAVSEGGYRPFTLGILTRRACDIEPCLNKLIGTAYQDRDCLVVLTGELPEIEILFAVEERTKTL